MSNVVDIKTKELTPFQSGDTVRVHYKIIEGELVLTALELKEFSLYTPQTSIKLKLFHTVK